MKVSAQKKSRIEFKPSKIGASIACALLALQFAPAEATINGTPSRMQAEQMVAQVRSQVPSLGTGVDLAVRNVHTNLQGRTVVHADQTYQGHRVWGSAAVIHADSNKKPHIAAQRLASAPVPKNAPILSATQASAIAMKAMALKGPAYAPKTELVVFPTKYQGGIATKLDPATHQYVLDTSRTFLSRKSSDPYVWAYEVHGNAQNKIDGIKSMKYVVDARTGAILHAESGMRNIMPTPNPPLQDMTTDQSAVGLGHSQYNGDVNITTTKHADGTYQMIDMTRGSYVNPWLAYYITDPASFGTLPLYDPNGNPISAVGIETMTDTHDGYGFWGLQTSFWWYDQNSTNIWGDGMQFVTAPYGLETTVNGQTTAVDVHYGMEVTWDFFLNIFGRNGYDDSGTSPVGKVHTMTALPTLYADSARWSEELYLLQIDDGSRNAGVYDDGTTAPTDPAGHTSMSALDIVAHELTHSVTNNTAAFSYMFESGALDEGTADIFSQMVEAYAKRPAGADTTIPNTGTDWLMGAQTGTPFRNLIKPSTDGYSPDNWYPGIGYLDPHSAGGPLTRMFYILAQGASSTVGDPSYSPYLPQGMTGIGNDHAARIWYQALYNYLLPDSGYADALLYAVQGATDLYGAGSPEVAAVKNAFKAINVCDPADTSCVNISLPTMQGANSPFAGKPAPGTYDILDPIPIVAMTTSVALQASVQNATNQAVTWTIGGFSGDTNSPGGYGVSGGIINADGTYTPNLQWGFHSMTVTSVQYPLQYAETSVWVVNGDADSDNEFDALDLGSVALSWGLSGVVKSSHSIMNSGVTNSYDVAAIVQAFINAFGGV